jgi:hypothetical protein
VHPPDARDEDQQFGSDEASHDEDSDPARIPLDKPILDFQSRFPHPPSPESRDARSKQTPQPSLQTPHPDSGDARSKRTPDPPQANQTSSGPPQKRHRPAQSIHSTPDLEECDWYPLWKWLDGSCSLDATLLVALQICENLPFYAARHEHSADLAFQTLYSHYQRWSSKPWKLILAGTMTKARNAVRKVLATSTPPVIVSGRSTLEDTLYRLIPPAMRHLEIRFMYSCSNQTCVERNHVKSFFPTSKTSHPVKVLTPECLLYPASYQKSIDTQTLLERVVRTRS